LPTTYHLSQNFPNPFNPHTRIGYQLPKTEHILVNIYNVLGESIKTLVDERQSAGAYSVIWDGTNDMGQKQANGVYVVSMQTASFQAVRKMTLLR
jgi:flagellar hook assembly protein FlgD